MQTTLLGLAIALILALVAALAGPFVIDWNNYRPIVEREATRLVGLPVVVRGNIGGRLLPSPQLSLNEVSIGDAGAGGFRAAALNIEFGLGPLMRGEWRAVEMRLDGPDVQLGLDAGGHFKAPGLSLNFDPEALSIERLVVSNGTLTLGDAASGATVALKNLWFNGDVRSLLGPVKGEGAFTAAGRLFPYRVSSGRYGADGTIKLRLNVDPSDFPLSIEADGVLNVADRDPSFEGQVSATRPVGIAQPNSGAQVTQPWRVGGKLKLSPKSALMELVEFQYGSGTQAARLSGTAEFRFGARPQIDGVMSGRQIDIDQLFADNGGTHEPPAVAVRRLVSAVGVGFAPGVPVRIGVGVDTLTIGGGNLQNLRGDLAFGAGGWSLDRFEFRAPGFTQVRVSGQLREGNAGLAFEGPADVTSSDPRALAAWLQGSPLAGTAPPRTVRLRGDLTLSAERLAVDHMRATVDREQVSGRVTYVPAAKSTPASLDADITATELDIDAVQGVLSSITQGWTVERPRNVSLVFNLDRAVFGGVSARQARARVKIDAGAMQIDQFAVADFGGAALRASGAIALDGKSQGNIAVDVDARDLAAVAMAAGRLLPDRAGILRELAPALSPARLRATLTLAPRAGATGADVAVTGTAGTMSVDVSGQASAAAANALWPPTDFAVKGQLSASDNTALARLLRLDDLVTTAKAAGQLTFSATSKSVKDVAVQARWTAKDVDAGVDGALAKATGEGVVALAVRRADLSGLRGSLNKALSALSVPLPVALTATLRVGANDIGIDDIAGQVAGSEVHGGLVAKRGNRLALSGALDFDRIDLGAVIAAGAGAPPSLVQDKGWSWPQAPFDTPALSDYDGRIMLKAARAALTPVLAARAMTAVATFGGDGFALDAVTADFAGGRLEGTLSLAAGTNGLDVSGDIKLSGVDAAQLTPGAVRPPLSGKFDARLALKGSGRSPATLVGSLSGTGAVTLTAARIAGLDPSVFVAVDAAAAARGDAADLKALSDLAGRALDAGSFAVAKASADVAVSGGQIRLSPTTWSDGSADVQASGRIDLGDGTVDARIVLSGRAEKGTRPSLFVALRGPLDSPARAIDVSALTGWLTMKSIERSTRQIKELESRLPSVTPPVVPALPEALPQGATSPTQQPAPPLPAPISIGPASKSGADNTGGGNSGIGNSGSVNTRADNPNFQAVPGARPVELSPAGAAGR